MEASEPAIDGGGGGWSEAVEDLVEAGDVGGAISILESVVARLEVPDGHRLPADDLRLASALRDLAGLHDSRGYSLKADELRSRALALRARAEDAAAPAPEPRDLDPSKEKKIVQKEQVVVGVSSTSNDAGEEEDDWEAIADRGLQDNSLLLSPQDEAGAKLKPSSEELEVVVTPNRRGRGSFLYKKSCLYSEQLDSLTKDDNRRMAKGEEVVEAPKGDGENVTSTPRKPRIGTSHVLVVYELSPSTRTTDLERIFEKYKDAGVAIRWVNDTVALAVFRTPALAREVQSSIQCPFKIRSLNDDDDLLSQIASKDLEPPCPRPKTSTRTAQRLIAQGMGYKPSSEFGSKELKKQEEERKNRILARQALRDEAWGSS